MADPKMMQGGGVLSSTEPDGDELAAGQEPANHDEATEGAPQPAAQQGGASTEQQMELLQLVASRVLQALTKIARELDAAMKADPVGGAVEMGTRALRQVAMGAQRAGKPLPLEILVAAGAVTIRELAAMAQEKGYIGASDAEAETFLKEVWQQSMQAYARMDAAEGLIDPQQAQRVASKAGGGAPPEAPTEGGA